MLVLRSVLPKNTNILGDWFVGEPRGRIYFWITGHDFWLESGSLFWVGGCPGRTFGQEMQTK